MDKLSNRWKTFLSLVLDPWALMLIVVVAVLCLLLIRQSDGAGRPLLTVLVTAGAATLGGRITRHWVEIRAEDALIARGRTVAGGLRLLLKNISTLELRVSDFISRKDEIENFPEVTKRNYEEIRELCQILEKEAVNILENWTDVLPEQDTSVRIES